MLRVPQITNQKLFKKNLIQTSYRISYKSARAGYLLLSQNDILVIVEKRGTYTEVLELCYEDITAITVEGRYQLTITDKKDQAFSFVSRSSTTAFLIEEDLKSRIAPLDYVWDG
jgi:hypothetical protein